MSFDVPNFFFILRFLSKYTSTGIKKGKISSVKHQLPFKLKLFCVKSRFSRTTSLSDPTLTPYKIFGVTESSQTSLCINLSDNEVIQTLRFHCQYNVGL